MKGQRRAKAARKREFSVPGEFTRSGWGEHRTAM